MTEGSSSRPLITADDVRGWVAERDRLAAEYGHLLDRLRSAQQRLDALAQILPEDVVARLIGSAPAISTEGRSTTSIDRSSKNPMTVYTETKFRKQVPITDAVENLLAAEPGGRTPLWLRTQLLDDPDFKDRIDRTPTSVSNALLRLLDRGKVLRVDGLYYHPDMYAKIQSGELVEERLGNTPSESFNSVMHSLMRERGGEFTAADAIAVARGDEFLSRKLREQPSRIYSWLSRELFKKKLQRTGELYSYPSNEEEAPSGNSPSASFAREGATSLFDNQQRHKP